MSPLARKWRDAAAYDDLDALDAGQTAFEFLRRDDDYRAAYPELAHLDPGTDPPPALTRWGLRFRCRPRPSRCRSQTRLAPECRSPAADLS